METSQVDESTNHVGPPSLVTAARSAVRDKTFSPFPLFGLINCRCDLPPSSFNRLGLLCTVSPRRHGIVMIQILEDVTVSVVILSLLGNKVPVTNVQILRALNV